MKPKLAAFPKGDFDALCAHTKSLTEWFDEASQLPIAGVEMYPDFYLEVSTEAVTAAHQEAWARGLEVPMMCSSPDFTHPDPSYRARQVEWMRFWIERMAEAPGDGLKTCRVLSGQRRPEVSSEEGIHWVIEAIETLLPVAAEHQVMLVIENHYKDGRWQYPEFAQDIERFAAIVDAIESPWFGVNYDPSNALVAGQDPLVVLERFKHRVRTMHASDRHLRKGYTLRDLASFTGKGYPDALEHGVIGSGLINYDAIFETLRSVNFKGWISIEDGVNGVEDLNKSAHFLNSKLEEYFW